VFSLVDLASESVEQMCQYALGVIVSYLHHHVLITVTQTFIDFHPCLIILIGTCNVGKSMCKAYGVYFLNPLPKDSEMSLSGLHHF
jgi:hypothetical protein